MKAKSKKLTVQYKAGDLDKVIKVTPKNFYGTITRIYKLVPVKNDSNS